MKKNDHCTNCGEKWVASEKYQTLCDNCFCPEGHDVLEDDIMWYQTGLFGPPLSEEAIREIRELGVKDDTTTIPQDGI